MFSLPQAISPYDSYCDGYGNPGASGGSYLVALNVGIGITKAKFSHAGSVLLDNINAFDRAEVDGAYLGQINMITVSSFCGPQGAIWGYHVAKANKLYTVHPDFPEGKIGYKRNTIPVYDAKPLFQAAKALFGTVEKKRFPLLPGSHVSCAAKYIVFPGPAHIYSCLALGIAKNRQRTANLLMEDIGHIYGSTRKAIKASKHTILSHVAESVLEIGRNQDIIYKEIFVGMKDVIVEEGSVGCALVATPYFTLAKKAYLENLEHIALPAWEKTVL